MNNSATPEAPNPIFIVGTNGSGTTMLADSPNNHRQIYIHPIEPRVIPYYYFKLEKIGDLQDKENFTRLLHSFSNNLAFTLCNDNQSLKIPFDFNHLEHKDYSEIIDLTFSYFAQKQGKPIWGDHSPKYALFIPVITGIFPKAKIIHIIRDGRDCAQSFKKRFAYNELRSISEWKGLVQKARKDGAAVGPANYFEVKYEDLTQNPEKYMNSICEFLDLEYDDCLLFSNMPMYKGELSNANKIVYNYGKWKEHFSIEQIKAVERIAGKTLDQFGYEVMFYLGDKNIHRIKLFALKLLDNFYTSVSYYKRYKGRAKARRFFGMVSTSLKQTWSKRHV